MTVKEIRRMVRGQYEPKETRISHVYMYVNIGVHPSKFRITRQETLEGLKKLSPGRIIPGKRVKNKLYLYTTSEEQ